MFQRITPLYSPASSSSMYRRRLYRRKVGATGTIIDKIVIVEEARKRAGLRLGRDAPFQFSRFLKHEAEQDMFPSHGLAHVPNARPLRLHPCIDHRFQSGHTITTLGAIKAFKPVHAHSLSVRIATHSFACRRYLTLYPAFAFALPMNRKILYHYRKQFTRDGWPM